MNPMDTTLSRRSLVCSAAGATAAAALAASGIQAAQADAAAVPPSWDAALPETWDRTCEMLVLGCGIAGACGAVEGADLGLDVLVVDAAPTVVDCCCTLSGGSLSGCCTEIQEANDIEDDVETMVSDIRRCGGDMGDVALIRTWCEMSGETVEWLEEIGCDVFDQVISASCHSIDRNYYANPTGSGIGWMQGLEKALDERGVEILSNTRATKLYRDASGVVVGAHVEPKDGEPFDIEATRGVLLAVGGLGNDTELWGRYCLSMKEITENAKAIVSGSPADVNGDGYRMLEAINGYCYPTPPNYGGEGVAVSENGPASGICCPWRWTSSFCEVNANGERFINETSFHDSYDLKIGLKQPGMWHVGIFDDVARQAPDGQAQGQPIIDEAMKNAMPTVVKAGTLEELAEAFGLPVDAVLASVEDFNAHVESQEPDEFGRTDFLGEKIATPPFWGFDMEVIVATSKGGSKINAQAQALDRFDQVIPHLYVAGEMAFFPLMGSSAEHITGGCNGAGAVFGRIAARSIAAE